MSFVHHADVGFESKADWQDFASAPEEDYFLAWNPEWEVPVWTTRAAAIIDEIEPTYWYPTPPLPIR